MPPSARPFSHHHPPLSHFPCLGHNPGHSAHKENSQRMRSTSHLIKFCLLDQVKSTQPSPSILGLDSQGGHRCWRLIQFPGGLSDETENFGSTCIIGADPQPSNPSHGKDSMKQITSDTDHMVPSLDLHQAVHLLQIIPPHSPLPQLPMKKSQNPHGNLYDLKQ